MELPRVKTQASFDVMRDIMSKPKTNFHASNNDLRKLNKSTSATLSSHGWVGLHNPDAVDCEDSTCNDKLHWNNGESFT